MFAKQIYRKLPVLLSNAELVVIGEELAHTHKEISTLTEDKARITARIKPKEKRIEELVVLIDTKEDVREVACRWEYSWTTGEKLLIRQDTFEAIETDLIQEKERQQYLFETDYIAPASMPDPTIKEEKVEEKVIEEHLPALVPDNSPCAACHATSQCDDCCKVCDQKCNSEQFCRKDGTAEEIPLTVLAVIPEVAVAGS